MTSRTVVRVTFAVCTVLTISASLVVAVPTVGFAQARFRAALSGRLDTIDVDYGPPVDAQGVILRGEPLVLEIGIVNRYDGPPATAEADWPGRVIGTLRRGGRFEDGSDATKVPLTCNPESMRSRGSVTAGGFVTLEPRGYQLIRCRLSADTDSLSPGRNTLSIEWAQSVDPTLVDVERVPGMPSPLRDVLDFEFREVVTPEDRADLWIHLANRALLDNELNDALQWVARVLRGHPSSTAALFIRGQIQAARGSCRDARADWDRVVEIVEKNADKAHRRHARLNPDERRSMVENLRLRSRAQCP